MPCIFLNSPTHVNFLIYLFFASVGSELVKLAIAEMVNRGCEEVMLEAEVTNAGALRLYANLGFIKDKRLQR